MNVCRTEGASFSIGLVTNVIQKLFHYYPALYIDNLSTSHNNKKIRKLHGAFKISIFRGINRIKLRQECFTKPASQKVEPLKPHSQSSK